jgi:uncharacterized SAM-binding protein YcdF (DUF218 family)
MGLWYVAVVFTPWVPWWARSLAGTWPDPKADVLIVLGSDAAYGVVGDTSYWRAFYAARLIREGGWQGAIVSGGGGVAEAIRDLMSLQGVPGLTIQLENKSGSTRENALFTAKLLAGDRRKKALLTSDFHMFRAVRAFRRAGLEAVPCPIPHAIKRATSLWMRPAIFMELGMETSKIVYYWWKGWI